MKRKIAWSIVWLTGLVCGAGLVLGFIRWVEALAQQDAAALSILFVLCVVAFTYALCWALSVLGG